MSDKHSKLLSPSGSGLWLICSAMPKALDESGVADQSSPAAERGTLQHTYAEKLRKDEIELKCPEDLDPDEWDQVITAVDSIDTFLNEEGTYASDPKQFREYHERQVAFSGWRKECFGTVDFVRLDIRLRKLYLFDYKFGRVDVSANKNPQLMIYALAIIEQFLTVDKVDLSKLIDEVVLGIAQPKVARQLETFTMSLTELLEWDEQVLQPAQRTILEGKGTFVPGSHCVEKYCKVRRNCQAYNSKGAEDMDNFVDLYNKDIAIANTINSLSIEELAELLDKAPLIEGILSDVKERAYELIDSGTQVPRYKLVEGQGKRVWTNEDDAATFLAGQKIKAEERYVKKLVTLPQAEKLLKEAEKLKNPRTATRFKELTEWKPGKPVLVPESDSRPAIVKQEHVDADIEDMFGLDSELDDLLASMNTEEVVDEVDDIDALLASL